MNQQDWTTQIAELEDFFSTATLKDDIPISKWERINKAETFVNNHLSMVKTHNGKPAFKSYLNRLLTYKNLIK